MKNLSREFATMTDEERRRFEQERGRTAAGAGNEEAADELELGDPRDEDRTGRHYASLDGEVAEPDAPSGDAAPLDQPAHRETVDQESKEGRRNG